MIRRYNKEDIKRIVELEHDNLLSSLEESYYLIDLNNPFAYHYVIEENNYIIGFISSIYDGFSLEILNIVIDKHYQSKGYGIKLITYVLDEIMPENVSLEVRESNVKAINLYKKLNFKEIRVRKNYYSNNENAIVMQKLYDDKKDIINLEAILFSKKTGIKYSNDFKERYALNYYDIFDYKIDSLANFIYNDYILFISNWIDYNLFKSFEIDKLSLMHVNAYRYKSISHNKYKIYDNKLTDYKNYIYNRNLEFGSSYSSKYCEYSYNNIVNGKEKIFTIEDNGFIIASVRMYEYYNSILIFDLFVKENYRHKGMASNLMDRCMKYAIENNKIEVYLEVDLNDTVVNMYKKMNFKCILDYYEILKVNS